MSRRLTLCLSLAVPLSAVAAAGAAAQGSTIRIEPRPFYGATITIEEGVRVFRALPPDRYVIINPNNAPVNLSISESRVIENSDVRHYNEGPRGSDVYDRYGGGGYWGGLPMFRDGYGRGPRRGGYGNFGRPGGGHGRPGGVP